MSTKNLSPKVVVSGASSGIGRAICLRLLKEQYSVIGIARDFTLHVIDHPRFSAITADLSQLDTLPEKLSGIAKANPDVSAVVFCAGRGQFGSLEEFSYQQIQDIINLNFLSQAYLAKAFLPIMKKHRSGKLIFIGSESALKAGRKGAVYSASKFALRGMAQALRDECAKSGISVSVINPGMVKTPFFDNLDFEPGPSPDNYLMPEEVANAVLYVLGSPFTSVIDEINLSPLKNVVRHKD